MEIWDSDDEQLFGQAMLHRIVTGHASPWTS